MVIHLFKGLLKTLMEHLKTLMELFKTLMELFKTLMKLVQTRYITGLLHVRGIFVIQSTLICYISYSLSLGLYQSSFCIQLFQLRLSPSKAERSNTSAKSLLGVTIKNAQTEQNLVSTVRSRDLYP